MQGGDLQFGGSHGGVRIGEGRAAESPPHPRSPQEPDPQRIQAGGKGHGPTGEAGGGQEQQPRHPSGVEPGQFHGHRAPHRGPDHAQRFPGAAASTEPLEQGLEVGQHAGGAVGALGWPGGEAEAVEVGNDQPVVGSEQGHQPAELEKGTVEAMEQQQRRALAAHRHRPAVGQALQLPPLHRPSQIPAQGVKQGPGCRLDELAAIADDGGLGHAG